MYFMLLLDDKFRQIESSHSPVLLAWSAADDATVIGMPLVKSVDISFRRTSDDSRIIE